ncbi:MAG: hypothetical protein JJE08_04205 [Proteiniphilum sp.]|nr:hypothetical protein [Proteiniphilum sp.]
MEKDLSLRTVKVMRYIIPLREGGSLPALAEADDGFKYVLKFRGAGHGTKMLVSELLKGSEGLIWRHTKETPAEIREIYLHFLQTRLQHSPIFLKHACDARG